MSLPEKNQNLRSRTYFLLTFILLPLVLILPLMFFKLRYLEKDNIAMGMVRSFDQREAPLLFLGDSVIKAVQTCYGGPNLGVDDHLRDVSRKDMVGVFGPGYSPVIFSSYVQLLAKTKYRPKKVMMGLNLRSFSAEWAERPDNNFYQEKFFIGLFLEGPVYLLKNLVPILKYRFLGFQEKEKAKLKGQAIVYSGRNLGTYEEVRKKFHDLPPIDCTGNREEDFPEEYSLLYRLNYMMDMREDHIYFRHLAQMKRVLGEWGIPLTVYLTPINFEKGVRMVGEEFRHKVNGNRQFLARKMAEMGIPFRDFSAALGDDFFIDRKFACEHLNNDGRKWLAQALIHPEFPEKEAFNGGLGIFSGTLLQGRNQ